MEGDAMEQRKKNNLTDLLMIHGAVLLFGLAGVISKGITTGSMMITGFPCFLATS